MERITGAMSAVREDLNTMWSPEVRTALATESVDSIESRHSQRARVCARRAYGTARRSRQGRCFYCVAPPYQSHALPPRCGARAGEPAGEAPVKRAAAAGLPVKSCGLARRLYVAVESAGLLTKCTPLQACAAAWMWLSRHVLLDCLDVGRLPLLSFKSI